MSGRFRYQDYVKDEVFLKGYHEYQRKYRAAPRESDKVILSIVREFLAARNPPGPVDLADIGCSTGNLLFHLKREFGDRLALLGGDLAESSLALCRADPSLAGIRFERLDVLSLPAERFEMVIVNAVLYMLSEEEHDAAWSSLGRSLRPGGWAVVFDFVHPFRQEIEILERTASHPAGLRIAFRSAHKVRAAAEGAGFAEVEFRPFHLPIDLPFPGHDAEVVTYTRRDERGERLAFRGVLYQPWCHIVAKKGGR